MSEACASTTRVAIDRRDRVARVTATIHRPDICHPGVGMLGFYLLGGDQGVVAFGGDVKGSPIEIEADSEFHSALSPFSPLIGRAVATSQSFHSKFNPDAFAPVAVTAAFAPAEFVFVGVGPLPVVVVDVEFPFGFVVVVFFDPSAIAVVVAYHGGGGRG